jgi:glutathione S-transferase
MAVKLHRCSTMWLKIGPHPCWKVQKALDDAGIEYEVVKHAVLRGKRPEVEALTGQRVLPAIELEDGTVIRRDSKELAEMIRSGQLAPGSGAAPPTA